MLCGSALHFKTSNVNVNRIPLSALTLIPFVESTIYSTIRPPYFFPLSSSTTGFILISAPEFLIYLNSNSSPSTILVYDVFTAVNLNCVKSKSKLSSKLENSISEGNCTSTVKLSPFFNGSVAVLTSFSSGPICSSAAETDMDSRLNTVATASRSASRRLVGVCVI